MRYLSRWKGPRPGDAPGRRTRWLSWLLAAVLVTATWVSAAGAAGRPEGQARPVPDLADRDGDRISEDLEDRLQRARAGERLDVIVRLDRPVDEAAIAALERAVGPLGVKVRWQRALHGFAASLTPAQVRALARRAEVERVEPDREVQAFLGTATLWTGVQKAWSDFGVDGDRDGKPASYSKTDVVIAVLDTGIDAAHVDLDGGKVIGWHDAVKGRSTPYDDHGHGTHVASIAAGTGEGNPAYRGVAPGAALVGIKVLNQQGSGTTSQILSGIDWMIRNRDAYGIRIGNMSLGSTGCSDGTDSLSAAVNNAVASGIAMVVAAGNSGPGKCTVGAPAAAADAITVGALYDPGEKGWVLAEFSSRGPTADGRVKPDVAAPGRNITAARAGTASGYVTYSGTSMATPFVAGTAALMLDASYGLSAAQVKNLLTGSANVKDFGPAGKDIDYGAGISVAYNAVKAAGGYTGTYSDGLQHAYVAGTLSGTGDRDTYTFTVTDATRPLGVAMIMANNPSCGLFSCNPDFDIYLYDPAGKLVGSSEGLARQEQILLQPATTGTYRLEVYSYTGSGSYFVDVSHR